ncbi:GTP pyrophosphokinase [Loigolactobacillus binensis]|uniref:GTP pyrophosphokinase family protein n=1 Tax=Loigolactobacillus binensis TaxID=2559922 RepID=A0ABW3EDJ3_9LACO|nr:GTP pyrophosphokinase family protein [Loigolactobacillus binensis]
MILERRNLMNFKKIGDHFKPALDAPDVAELQKLAQLYQLSQAGANEIGTKLENLDAEFQVNHDHNPIHHMEERMKDVQSLVQKLARKNLALSIDNVQDHIFDVAGIRVVTNYIADVYLIEKLLLKQTDVTLIRRKDYIKTPKPSGYRSLHIVVAVPVFQAQGSQAVNVEIQIRTVGMDMWASLEHKLRYKTDMDAKLVEQYGNDLQGYANELAQIETKMQHIYQQLNDFAK